MKFLKARNSRDFKKRKYKKLQKGSSPLSNLLNFDVIFMTVYDYMHQICLGIMKNLIRLWLNFKDKKYKKKKMYMMKYLDIVIVDANLKSIRKSCPKEFGRKCREMSDVTHWKATEFRMLLLYVGPIILRKRLSDVAYKHFLLLHFAVRLLCDPSINVDSLNLVKVYLKKFVVGHASVYGRHSISHNVHTLLHVCDDVTRFGNVDAYSAFPFENYLFKIRRAIRAGSLAIQQLINRIEEHENLIGEISKKSKNRNVTNLSKKHDLGPVTSNLDTSLYHQFRIIETKNFTLDCAKHADRTVITINHSVALVENIMQNIDSQEILLVVRQFLKIDEAYDYPSSSKCVGIYQVKNLSENVILIGLNDVSHKGFHFTVNGDDFVCKILHTLT